MRSVLVLSVCVCIFCAMCDNRNTGSVSVWTMYFSARVALCLEAASSGMGMGSARVLTNANFNINGQTIELHTAL
eukprot:m.145858 g.145858  ORF g.145858 m.145858 type:complete len:75 (-) comp17745_c0_seq3:466-690(-)